MLTAAGNASLVAGSLAENDMKMKRVKVLRAFSFHREVLPVDTEIELPYVFGLEVIASKKAEAVGGEQPEPKRGARRTTKDKSGDTDVS